MRNKRSSSLAALGLFAATFFVSPAVFAGRATSTPEGRAPSALVETTPTRERTVERDASRYAERETKAKAQAEYRGGDFVVVGISGGVLLLILVLVIIL